MEEDIVGLIAAAGEGRRLFPFSKAVPKEMYPILGKAVIEHSVENLKEGGIKKIYIVVGYQKGGIMDYIGDGSLFGVDVAYIYQLERKGLGHAVLQSKNWIKTTFTVLLGDSFIEPKKEILDLIKLHKKEKPIATILLFEVKNPKNYGIAKFNTENHVAIEKLIEKPSEEEAKKYRNNGKYYAICGAYVFEPKIFEYIMKTKPGSNNEIQLTDAVQMAINNGEKVTGLILKGKYLDVGKWHTVLNIEKDLLKNTDIDSHIKERENLITRMRNK